MKNINGITLIALIITIIVLIILSGITINFILGENGIIEKGQEGKINYKQSETNEQSGINQIVDQMSNLIDSNNETKDQNLYLTKNGKIATEFSSKNNAQIIQDEDYFKIKTMNTASRSVYYTSKKIDLTGYSKLNIDIEVLSKTSSSSGSKLLIALASNDPSTEELYASVVIANTNETSKSRNIYTLDVSSINEKYIITILKNATMGATQTEYKVYDIWLEK